mgnify:CR=1 FL=1
MNLVVQFSMSCAFFAALPRGSQLVYYTTLSFVCQEVFQTFFKFFSLGSFGTLFFSLASLRLVGRSLAAPIVYHIRLRLSSGFQRFFGIFGVFLRSVSISPKYRPNLHNPSGIGGPFAYPDTSLLSSTDHEE